MEKSPDAFRTISEVAEWLDIPTHVLRFRESRFSQIKPVKRAGGRRYYRPSDMRLIGGIKVLLHDQGMTIRSVQKLLREQGVKHVSAFSKPLHGEAPEPEVVEHEPVVETPVSTPAPAATSTHDAEPEPVPEPSPEPEPEEALADADDQPDMFPDHDPAPVLVDEPVVADIASETTPEPEPEPVAPAAAIPATPDVPETDAPDDDERHSDIPGIAARLATVPTAQLTKHRDALKSAADRLSDIRQRLG